MRYIFVLTICFSAFIIFSNALTCHECKGKVPYELWNFQEKKALEKDLQDLSRYDKVLAKTANPDHWCEEIYRRSNYKNLGEKVSCDGNDKMCKYS